MTCIRTHTNCYQRPKADHSITIMASLACHTPQHKPAPSCISCSCSCPLFDAVKSVMSVVRHTAGPQEYDAQVIPRKDVSLAYGGAFQTDFLLSVLMNKIAIRVCLTHPAEAAGMRQWVPSTPVSISGRERKEGILEHYSASSQVIRMGGDQRWAASGPQWSRAP